MEILEQNKKRIGQGLFVLVIILSIYFAVKTLGEIKKMHELGESPTPATISFSGHGEVKAVPDIASIYFNISKDAQTVKDAQDQVAAIEKKALNAISARGVEDKDIQTADASFYPKYDYSKYNNSTIIGYTASESITVKVRKTDDAGLIIQDLGSVGVSNLNGPSFTIDNEDSLKAEARKKAIDDAKEKAEVLAKDLGVHLGKIVSFSENNNGPIMYAQAAVMKDSAVSAPAPAQLPKGENTISSDVSITFEIR
jgi:uncharacterized protein YggE